MVRRPRPSQERSRRAPAALLALLALAAVLLWWLRRDAPPPPQPVQVAALVPAPPPPKRPRPIAPAKPRPWEPDRGALQAAIAQRAADLSACPASAARPDVPVRLRIARAGPVQSLEFVGAPPQADQAACLRKAVLSWDLAELHLQRDVTLLTTFMLSQRL